MSSEAKQRVCVRGVLIHDEEVLLIKRAAPGSYQGYFEVPGGSMDAGEDTVIREFKEETGINVKVEQYIRDFSWVKDNGVQRVEVLFKVKLAEKEADFDKQTVEISSEHSEFTWADWNSLDELKISDEIKKAIKKVIPQKDTVVKNKPSATEAIVYTDGGSRGNPGPSASGFVIMTTDKEIIDEGGEYLGITTNNQAEYKAVVVALESAKRLELKDLDFYIDSLLVVNQLNGKWRVKNEELRPVYEQIKELAKNFDSVKFTHVYRENNTYADGKVNEVLDAVADKSHDTES
jgi:ribonuclease HI/ADP-ribose pyrophosphatase YjhB (NUDIX family)